MASYNYQNQNEPYEVEMTISSANNLKNVNWRHGPLKPYAVVWISPNSSNKSSTNVDSLGDTSPVWNEKLTIPVTGPIDDATLSIDIVQADAAEDTKPLIGSARLPLREVLDNSGVGERVHRSLPLKRPSGRPHGTIEVKILMRRQASYHPPPGHYAPPYGVPLPQTSRDYNYYGTGYGSQPPPVPSRDYNYDGGNYGSQPPGPYYSGGGGVAAPSYGYGYGGEAGTAYGGGVKAEEKKKSGKFGVGTGLAVGAVAGVLGGLALAEGVEHMENKIAEKVEDDLKDDYGGGYDDYGDDDY
ncbi:hypothetical protein Scep_001544 [Stephania cephalantha]|uniref:C2 domain-containing protein n=1 Tax=Stephania cephalantha TaxID=152367 RepID=A0AAP0L9J4_9MAGN